MIDMGTDAGKKRFYIYDKQGDSILGSGLVAHGQGKKLQDEPVFSNAAGSYCTSLGKYRVGTGYMGKFGLAYKLHGLDESNNNALNRFVVLHAHACVPNEEVYPNNICQSQGCPTVSPLFLSQLSYIIEHAKQPMLLSIYP